MLCGVFSTGLAHPAGHLESVNGHTLHAPETEMHNLGVLLSRPLAITLHTMQKIRIKIRAFDHMVIDEAARLIIETAEKTGALVAGPIPLPTKIEKFTVLKSTFVNKDAREQYEIRRHHRLIDITQATPATIEELSSLSVPSGVDIEIKMIMEEEKKETKKKAAKK